jgi:predicted PurR-regulated permease PerM
MPIEHHPQRDKPGFAGIDPRAARATWTAALVLLLLALIYAVRGTLILFAIALLFSYLLYPLIELVSSRFPARHRPAILAASYLVVLGILAGIGIAIGSQVASEARDLAAKPPDVKEFLSNLETAHPSAAPAIRAAEGRLRDQLGEVVSAAPRMGLHVLAASANLIDLVVIPILSFFMLKDGLRIRDSFLEKIPEGRDRQKARKTLSAVHSLLLSYMRALLLLCCSVLVVFSIVLSVMGVPYALLLASIAFLCEFVPMLGPLTAAIVIIAVSALSGYSHVIGLVVFLACFRLVQDYMVSPRLMGSNVELHPLLVIFGVFAGAEVGGVAGVFLSVPILALARLIFERFREKSEYQDTIHVPVP